MIIEVKSEAETQELAQKLGAILRGGEIIELRGDVGAGKTTLLRLLLGYITPTAGTASVAGFDCVRES
ncbi:MAG: tRNA (adenosine(37)-N6)-threonylcarbamoyltransferase complex ATPase subunit type 1 TsaE, partial [Candidatus Obscuribacterales bacterium]|nr:tRNA (adenosine(37)-N6)-threonylcarbamoyltransferase complex ATPase subunit type 1 TsaE [Candidatus Obscuribacterales bacterium]